MVAIFYASQFAISLYCDLSGIDLKTALWVGEGNERRSI